MISKLLLSLVVVVLLVEPSTSLTTPTTTNSGLHRGLYLRRGTFATILAKASNKPTTIIGGASVDVNEGVDKKKSLPRELMPITIGVFAQMLGEGIALSSLPLYLTRLGASPLTVGAAISCFSVAQMTFAPILVGLSSRIGRSIVLRICLGGAACASLLIALSESVNGVIVGRTLAGVFAACIPVAQSGVTDILDRDQASLGLSRVSAAAQLGVVVGPAASAILQSGFATMGIPSEKCLPAVFVSAALFTLSVLTQMTVIDRRSRLRDGSPLSTVSTNLRGEETIASASTTKFTTTPSSSPLSVKGDQPVPLRMAQPMLRTITVVIGWTAILSNSIYGLFAPRFMGFQQAQLSATYSTAAILAVCAQVVFPRLSTALGGTHRTCTLGILAAGLGIGGQSLIRIQPFHSILYMFNRVGASIADTSTATLVASSSGDGADRAKNLAYLTSTRAAARIVTPLLSSKLFEMSCNGVGMGVLVPGALPFVTAACLAMGVVPLPTLLLRAAKRKREQLEKQE